MKNIKRTIAFDSVADFAIKKAEVFATLKKEHKYVYHGAIETNGKKITLNYKVS